MTTPQGQTYHDWQWAQRFKALYTAQVSYLYHRRRQRFFDLADKWTKAATVLAGASMLSVLVKDHLPVLGAGISGLGLLSLVFAYSDRKQAHRELAEAFADLVGQIERTGEHDFTSEDVKSWNARQQALNAKEPPTLHTLTTICQNEVSVALGKGEAVVKVNWFKRQLSGFFSFG